MDSFLYNPKPHSQTLPNPDHKPFSFSGILEIHIHHARNIHNICIYDNQDVYAKFSLTSRPDHTLTTAVIPSAGKNPNFNQTLNPPLKINHPADSVLKCEIWMLSRARNYMDDQLLGFALVQLSEIISGGNVGKLVTGDYTLSSTDLFHSPAGTVRLSLKLDTSSPMSVTLNNSVIPEEDNSSSIASEVVLLDMGDPALEYSRIEFPDINVAVENQQMVSDLFRYSPGGIIASFLKLGSSPEHDTSENLSPATTMTTLGDDVIEKKRALKTLPESSSEEEGREKELGQRIGGGGGGFKVVQGEAEQSAMQQQIVGMYMRSMKQFTESLAKMKLPTMDVDKTGHREDDIIGEKKKKKKDGSARVFYGSRAFF